ncbi:MAG: hypothetical protein Q8L98_02390 [Chlamydiales bacterium]|nr:hypothetical protein [Chlamydiales bacterium]
MSMTVGLDQCQHVYVPSHKRPSYPCEICKKEVAYGLVQRVEQQRDKVFHKRCLFIQEEGWGSLNFPCSLFYLLPDFSLRYPKTHENQQVVATLVAELYAFFFSKQEVFETFHEQLSGLGMSVCTPSKAMLPRKEKIENLFQSLKSMIYKTLLCTHQIELKTLYISEPRSILSEACKRASIDIYEQRNYLPQFSAVSILQDHDVIVVSGSFSSSLGEEGITPEIFCS